MKTAIIIPARYSSSRYPGKPLAKINGKELILWVNEIAEKTVGKKHTYVATDSIKISEFLKRKKINTILTSPRCLTGTDRVAESSLHLNYEIFVNLQGDEPLVKIKDIKKIIKLKKKFFNCVICGYTNFSQKENIKNINIPKVIFNKNKKLIYLSRLPIPGYKNFLKKNDHKINYYKQVCIYAFNKLELQKFYKTKKKSIIEKTEDIELLRFFDLDTDIMMVKTSSSSMAVDVKSDIKKIERYLNG
jgi:3-deoxy-manno-octulosonate cytidylyltransferase (CMP-KDO synthetase)